MVILQSEIVLFTGTVGDVETVELRTDEDIENLFHVPLYVGCPEFKLEGLLKSKRFREEQIEEMNHIHGIAPLKLDMDYVVNNSRVALFDDIREAIKLSRKEKIQDVEDVYSKMGKKILLQRELLKKALEALEFENAHLS